MYMYVNVIRRGGCLFKGVRNTVFISIICVTNSLQNGGGEGSVCTAIFQSFDVGVNNNWLGVVHAIRLQL